MDNPRSNNIRFMCVLIDRKAMSLDLQQNGTVRLSIESIILKFDIAVTVDIFTLGHRSHLSHRSV